VAALVAGYLIGNLTYGQRWALGRAIPKRLHTYAEARRVFVARTPEAAGRGLPGLALVASARLPQDGAIASRIASSPA
jgi:hypothetical protein